MKKIAVSRFKSQCLKLLNEIQTNGETILITRRGKLVAKLLPVSNKPKKLTDDIFGFLKGKVKIIGDIVSPLPPEDWGNLA